MCNNACMQFGRSYLSEDEIKGKKVLEVGALDVNGSLRTIAENFQPSSYTGVDIANGPGVDEICDISDLVARFGKESFDVVITTELMEHVRNWRDAVSNLKNILKPNGVLLLTTRSKAFPYHGYPYDFWRYEREDMEVVFSDLSIEKIEKDSISPGVFVKARKPEGFREKNLEAHRLYSVIAWRRRREIHAVDILLFKVTWTLRSMLSRMLPDRVKATYGKIKPS